MESALAEAKQVQETLGEYHEGTHVILEKASSAAKANAERPGDGRMKHISVEYRRMLSRTKKYVWRKVGTKKNVADGLANTASRAEDYARDTKN